MGDWMHLQMRSFLIRTLQTLPGKSNQSGRYTAAHGVWKGEGGLKEKYVQHLVEKPE